MQNKPDSTTYIRYMEEKFSQLQADINTLLAGLTLPENYSELDDYIYEVNRFYYRSFDEEIFPSYRRVIQDDMSSLLNLSLSAETLKEGILSTIKRYAQLYNQVKRLNSALTLGKETTYQHLVLINREEDRRSIELSSALMQFKERLQAAYFLCQGLSAVLADKDLNTPLIKNPSNVVVLQFMDSLNLGQPLNGAGFNTLLSNLRFNLGLLVQLQKEDKPSPIALSLIKNLQEKTNELGGKKTPSSLQQFTSFMIDRINSCLQPLEFYARHSEQKLLTNTVRQLTLFLEDVIVLMERSQHYLLSGNQEALNQVTRGFSENPSMITNLSQNLKRTISALDELQANYASPGQSDFQHFSRQTRILLEDAETWMEALSATQSLGQWNNLITRLHLCLLELQYLIRWIDLVEEDSRERRGLHDAHLSLINNVDIFLNLLGNIRSDLERMLASRNLARLWKDLAVSVERVPLEKDKVFPPQHLALLNKHPVQEKWGNYEDYMVLYEEGDLFIIRVEGLCDEEIPYMLIGRKGQ